MIVACLALLCAATVAAPADTLRPDTLRPDAPPFVLERAGGFERLSDDPSRPVEPAGLAFDSFGRVYVSDAALRRLVRYSPDGRRLGETGALGDDANGLRRPGSVVPAGVILVAVLDEEARRIVAYDLQGHVQGVAADLDAALESRGGAHARPIAMASDRSGAFYVADADGDRVLVLDSGGKLLRELGGTGAGGRALHGVAGIAVARKGDVWVSERMPGRIVRLDPTGALRSSWALPDSTAADRLPLAVDDSSRVACADPDHERLWLFAADGRALAVAEGVRRVSALAFSRDGSLWVAERGERRLVRFRLVPRGRPTEP